MDTKFVSSRKIEACYNLNKKMGGRDVSAQFFLFVIKELVREYVFLIYAYFIAAVSVISMP